MSLRPAGSLTLPSTRAGAVANELRRQIIAGELAPGTQLRQNEIAERFGVSSTPVREAFTALAREGFVRQDPHRGVVVFEPSLDDLQENYEIRAALEGLAAELAAKAIEESELDELDEVLAEMRDRGRDDHFYYASVLNPRLHSIINRAARRPRLLEMVSNLRATAVAYQTVNLGAGLAADPDYFDAVHAEHEEIVAALHARAPKRAAKAVRRHIEHNRRVVTHAISRNGAAGE